MNSIIVFIIGVILGSALVWFFMRNSSKQHSNILENVGISKSGSDLIKNKVKGREENMTKVLNFLKEKEKFSNNDIEKLFGVSDSTATRYLDELEKEGKIRQVGKTGRNVYYERI